MVYRRSVPRRSPAITQSRNFETRTTDAGRGRMPRVMRPSWIPHAVLLVSFLGAGCKSGSDKPADAKTLRIGVITSLTGPAAAFGAAHKYGYSIAQDDLNAKGGVLGKQIEVIYYDDQSKPDQAVQGVAKLVDQDHVAIILGAYSSESTRAVIPAVTQKGIPLIMPTATADNVVETGSPWVFRICAGANAYATAMADFLKNNGAPKTMAIIYENTNFGQANARSMVTAAPAAGIEVVDQEAYQASSPDYKSLLQRVKAKNPEVVYYASYLLDATTLMRQTAEIDLNPKFLAAAGTGFSAAEFPTDKGAGKYAEYTFSVSQWLPSAKWEGSRQFDDEYFKRAKSHPAYHGMQAYAALVVAADAINNAKSDQPKPIADAIRTEHLNTPFGPIAFDAKGQNAHPVLISQVQNGQYKVVWPPDAAESKPMPTPAWSDRK
jgi:branched-chain amino acid transport system substrate-binding protein